MDNLLAYELQNGYAVIRQTWKKNDKVEVHAAHGSKKSDCQ